jgi:hypothetical protein
VGSSKVTREAYATENATQICESFSPLRGRPLGTLEQPKLKELGFEGEIKELEITTRKGTHKFKIASPKKAVNPYLRDEENGQIYVIGNMSWIVSTFEQAQNLLQEKKLHWFDVADFDGVTVELNGKRLDLVQTNPNTPATAQLAPRGTPDKPNPKIKAWHDKLWLLTAEEVLGKGEAPNGKIEVPLRIEYLAGKKKQGWTEIGVIKPDAPPASPISGGAPPPAPKPVIFARSEGTLGWMRLSGQGLEMLNEAEKLFAE